MKLDDIQNARDIAMRELTVADMYTSYSDRPTPDYISFHCKGAECYPGRLDCRETPRSVINDISKVLADYYKGKAKEYFDSANKYYESYRDMCIKHDIEIEPIERLEKRNEA